MKRQVSIRSSFSEKETVLRQKNHFIPHTHAASVHYFCVPMYVHLHHVCVCTISIQEHKKTEMQFFPLHSWKQLVLVLQWNENNKTKIWEQVKFWKSETECMWQQNHVYNEISYFCFKKIYSSESKMGRKKVLTSILVQYIVKHLLEQNLILIYL